MVRVRHTKAWGPSGWDVVEFENGLDFCVMHVGTGAVLGAHVEHEWGETSELVESYLDVPQQRVGFIDMISVKQRGQGRGELLLTETLKWCDASALQLVGLAAVPIVDFSREFDAAQVRLVSWYGRHGFEVLTAHPVERGPVEMVRALPRRRTAR